MSQIFFFNLLFDDHDFMSADSNCSVLIQKKAMDVSPELKGTSIFLVGKHCLLLSVFRNHRCVLIMLIHGGLMILFLVEKA